MPRFTAALLLLLARAAAGRGIALSTPQEGKVTLTAEQDGLLSIDVDGLIIADPYDADVQRWPQATPLAAARRRALTLAFARTAAGRLGAFVDPSAVQGWS